MADKQISFFDLASSTDSLSHCPEKTEWNIFIDGASRGNPGPSGIGVYIQKNNELYEKYACYIGKKTNNQAEYLALLLALFFLKKKHSSCDRIAIISDSQLLINQMKGMYKIRNVELKQLYDIAQKESVSMRISYQHVLREKNLQADALANEGIDKKKSPPLKFLDMLQKYEMYL